MKTSISSSIKQLMLKLLVLLPVLLLTTTTINGQTVPGQETTLVGSWTFAAGPSFAKIIPEDQELLDSSPQMKTQVMTGYVNRTLVFNPDGSFGQTDGSGKQVFGTWNLQGQTLTIQSLKGNLWVQQIILLDNDQLVLQQIAMGEAEPLIPELHFTKNQ